MIPDIIINALFSGINALLSLMPDFAFTTDQTGSREGIGTYAAYANSFLPLNTVVQITALAFSIRLAMAGWDFIVWLYHQFWGSS